MESPVRHKSVPPRSGHRPSSARSAATRDARVLLLTGSPAHYMAPPRLGTEQITGGPDWKDQQDEAGRFTTMATPVGQYDVAPLLARLPPEQQPEVLVCLVDASRRNLPRNVGAFRGPKVLLVADTHHLTTPISTMVRYAASETYDRLVFLYDRHHAAIFHAAGFRNLFWFPGLTFPHDDAFVRQSRSVEGRVPQVAFVGQAGRLHPRRARLLEALQGAGLPLAQQALGQRDALPFYGASLFGFNSSLNGDLNLRVFEILASGALLLTDRLAPASGLSLFLQDGRDCLMYDDERELVEKAKACLAQPAESSRIAAAGARWFLESFGEERRRALFGALAFDGKAPPLFPLPAAELDTLRFRDQLDLQANVLVYEGIQELHRIQPDVRVVVDGAAPPAVTQLFATLPRVYVRPEIGEDRADLIVTGAQQAPAAAHSRATHVWCWDAARAQLPELTALFTATGYAAATPQLAFYSLRPAAGAAA